MNFAIDYVDADEFAALEQLMAVADSRVSGVSSVARRDETCPRQMSSPHQPQPQQQPVRSTTGIQQQPQPWSGQSPVHNPPGQAMQGQSQVQQQAQWPPGHQAPASGRQLQPQSRMPQIRVSLAMLPKVIGLPRVKVVVVAGDVTAVRLSWMHPRH